MQIIPRETTLDVIVDPFDMLHVSDNSLAAFGKSNLEPAEKLCNEADVPFEAHIVLTDEEVREELCERADKLGADVLVVGARGLGLLSRYEVIVVNQRQLTLMDRLCRLILGSVSEYATNNAPCNVCIVR